MAPFTSAYCGFDVVITIEGKLMVRLFFDKNGNPVRELDFQPSTKVTFSAPHSGRSFTFAEALVSRFDYSKGADIGSEVIITITGTGQRIGSFVDAGRLVIRGEIFDISPEGIPFVDFLEEVSQAGRVAGDTLDARCEALA